MRSLYCLLALCCMSLSGYGQTLDPAGSGGFETGTTFASNGWTVVNPPVVANNQWAVGTAAGAFAGSRAVYITTDGGTTYTYNTGVAKTAHFYRDIVVPAGATSISLNFEWKGRGEVGADRMLVYTAPVSVTPLVNMPVSPSTTITGATLVWTQPDAVTTTYTPASISLPAALAGTTVRLIFTWQTNASLGITPGAAVDNIAFTFSCPPPVSGTPTVCVGATTSLADAYVGGTWSSSTAAVGTVASSGVVTGIAPGTTTISYTQAGCPAPATIVVSVNGAAAAITGPSHVCIGNTITLGETATGGTWSSMTPTVAFVNTTGDVTGNTMGTTNITYTTGCGAPAVKAITVDPLPAPIGATVTHVCEGGATISLSDATAGGTWSASPAAIATAATTGPTTGIVTGVSDGTATVTYTSAAGCTVTRDITVDPLPTPIMGDTAICTLNSTTLSDALAGGSWTSSVPGVATVGSNTGIVTGITGGTTIISYTNACGSATAIFTVNPYPGAIVGPDSLCMGSTTTLANPLAGGSWTSSNVAVATVLPSSGLVTGVAAGTTRITYSLPGGCRTTKLETVVPPPPSIAGLARVCPGTTTTLSESVSGGTWTSANTVAATVNASTGVVTGITADTVHIIYTTHSGCNVFVNLTVDPLPAPIAGHIHFCALTADTLSDPTAGGTWSSSAPGVASINPSTGVVAPLATGTVTIKYTAPTTCFITRTFSVDPLPVPVISFNTTNNTMYTDSTFVHYQWYHTVLGAIPGATGHSTPGLHDGNYYVVVTDINGCTARSANFAYALTMGVQVAGGNTGISIYPNPASDKLYIVSAQPLSAVISTIDGRTEIEQANAGELNISSLANGVHIISLYNKDGIKVAVRKVVKQ